MCQFVDSKIWVIFFRYSCWTLVLPPVCLKLPPKLPHNIICFPSRPIFFPPHSWPFFGVERPTIYKDLSDQLCLFPIFGMVKGILPGLRIQRILRVWVKSRIYVPHFLRRYWLISLWWRYYIFLLSQVEAGNVHNFQHIRGLNFVRICDTIIPIPNYKYRY